MCLLFVTNICNFITLFYATNATNQCALAVYMWSKFLPAHVYVVKLFDDTFFCFPLAGSDLITLNILFDCLEMKSNILSCFSKT